MRVRIQDGYLQPQRQKNGVMSAVAGLQDQAVSKAFGSSQQYSETRYCPTSWYSRHLWDTIRLSKEVHARRFSETTHLEREKYQNQRYHSTTIHCSTGNVVKLRPPCEIPLADDELEYEAYHEPRRVINARGRRYKADAVKENGSTDEFNPRARISSLPKPERYWQDSSHRKSIKLRMIQWVSPKLLTGPDETPAKKVEYIATDVVEGHLPDSGRSIEDLIMRTSKVIRLVRFANIVYAGKHPRFDSDLHESRQKCSNELCYRLHFKVNDVWYSYISTLTDENSTRRYLDVVTQFEVLHEGDGFNQGLDWVGLEDHICQWLPGQQGSWYDLRQNIYGYLYYGIEISLVNHSERPNKHTSWPVIAKMNPDGMT